MAAKRPVESLASSGTLPRPPIVVMKSAYPQCSAVTVLAVPGPSSDAQASGQVDGC